MSIHTIYALIKCYRFIALIVIGLDGSKLKATCFLSFVFSYNGGCPFQQCMCAVHTAMLPMHEAPDGQTNPLIIFISATVSYRLMSSRTFNSLEKKPKTRQITSGMSLLLVVHIVF